MRVRDAESRRVWSQPVLSTAQPTDSSVCTAPATGEPWLLERDAPATLAFLLDQHAEEETAAVRKLQAVMHYADLHRVVDSWTGALSPELRAEILDAELREAERAARQGRPLGLEDGPVGQEAELRLAGEGTFMVAEFAVTELAAALGMSEAAARRYVGEAVELRDRLPRLCAQVLAGRLASWRARLVAHETIPLTAEAAAHVDAALAPFAGQVSPWRVARAVEAAVLLHDPDLAARRAREAAEKRGVWVEDGLDGVSELRAVANTPDVAALDAPLDAVATSLGALGDTDLRQARRAKALGVLADPQYALDLHATASGGPQDVEGECLPDRGPDPHRVGSGPSGRPVVHIHLHVGATDAGFAGAMAIGPVARVSGYGARATATVEQWLADWAPGAVVTLTPVVDSTHRVAVDAYEIPDRIRAVVEERDLCCSFPWCGSTSRFDLDHIDPYVAMAGGGPPGQTTAENLARLCRYHHRVKTHPGRHGRWHYRRRRDGTLLWTSPLGQRYLVDGSGTRPCHDTSAD